jgi:NAD-dependent SIR2 family protein deacetylase
MTDNDQIKRAAAAIRGADALLITAGAGMGVDSGLPDFRGPEGFWKAYPPYRKLGLLFEQLANPVHFDRDPHLAWGFYGHRLNLYRETKPHAGFAILSEWESRLLAPDASFVFTSNVDGQFAIAGFDPEKILECHGSIHYLQCTRPRCEEIWPATGINIAVDLATMRAADPLPTCPRCGRIARPNILMFGDVAWLNGRTDTIERRYQTWSRRQTGNKKHIIIECGAGTAIPTVRIESESFARTSGGTLIRINLREPQVPTGHIGIPLPAAEALQRIAAALVLCHP